MEIERADVEQMKEKKNVYLLIIGACVLIGYWGINYFILKNEERASWTIEVSKFFFLLLFGVKMVELLAIHGVVNGFYFYQRMKNTKTVYRICKKIDKQYKDLPETKQIFYPHDTHELFVRIGVLVLNTLPQELEVILENYPTNFNFKNAKKELHLGVRTLHNGDIKTNSITLFYQEKYHNYILHKMRSTVFHEIGHHIDNVLGEVYYGKGAFFSEKDEEFENIYKKDLIHLEDYFLESKPEFFAETVSLYFLGDLSPKELNEYYENLFKSIIKLIDNKKVR